MLHGTFIAVAFPGRMVVIAAGTRVHGGDQHEIGRIIDAISCSADCNFAVFEGLAHDFQDGALKFRQFVKKKHSIGGQGDFPGMRECSSSDQCNIGNRVMGRAEGTGGDQ